jgi:hypothetical protein
MTAIIQIHKSRYRKPSAHDYGLYTIDIDHGKFCRCCTPIDESYLTTYEKNKLKKLHEKQEQAKEEAA